MHGRESSGAQILLESKKAANNMNWLGGGAILTEAELSIPYPGVEGAF